MKFAFLITGLNVGGAETQLLRISTGLLERGHRIVVLPLLAGGALEPRFNESGIPLLPGPSRRFPSSLVELRRFRPDAIAAFMFHATVAALAVAPLVGRPPILSSIRDPNYGHPLRLRAVAAATRAGWIDRIVANSTSVGRAIAGQVGAHRCEVVPNAIDASRWSRPERPRRVVRSELGLADEEFVWLAVGNWRAEKDYPTLLRAFGDLPARARLCIAGRGTPSDAEAALLDQDRVQVLGPRADVRELMHAADGFVLSSKSEGLPNALMEAGASGLPAVATRVGGVPEILADEDGLVPPGDPRALSEAMVRLMELGDPERAGRGRRARETVARRFGQDAIVSEWERVLASVARGRADASS